MTVYGDMLVSEDDASFYASVELEVSQRDARVVAVTDDEGNERSDLIDQAEDCLSAGSFDPQIHDAIEDERKGSDEAAACWAEDTRDDERWHPGGLQ